MSGNESTIPPAKHDNYVLLWDFAAQMAKETGESVEACWLQILDAVWADELPALLCFTHPRSSAGAGRVLLELPPREVLAGHLLGQQRDIDETALAVLRGWTLDDYLRDEIFGGYVIRDPRFGLAAQHAGLQRWFDKHRIPPTPEPVQPQARRGRRPRADWEAVELALHQEIERRGFCDVDNDDPSWRCQADVERWAAQLLEDRRERVQESWLREKVSRMLKHIEAGKVGN